MTACHEIQEEDFTDALCGALTDFDRTTEVIRDLVEKTLRKPIWKYRILDELSALAHDGVVVSRVNWITPGDRVERPVYFWRWPTPAEERAL